MDVFVYDRQLSQTHRISTSANGEQGNNLSHVTAISADGNYVVFVSEADNLVGGDTNNNCDMNYDGVFIDNCPDIFLRRGNWANPPATLTVNTTADTNDGTCDAAHCSLREAIIAANANPDVNTINVPAGTYTLSIAGTGEDATATGDLDITADVTIQGAGAATTIIDGGQIDRIMDVFASVTVTGITLTNGNPGNDADGGGARIGTAGNLILTNSVISDNTARWGGGIDNNTETGQLSITNSSILDNTAQTSGGINNFGTVTITDSTISGNTADWAGGMYNGSSGVVTITRSLISANSALSGGGGITNDDGGVLDIINTTLSGNTTNGTGGGISNYGDLQISHSTIAGNSAANGGGLAPRISFADTELQGTLLANNSGGNCFVESGDSLTSNGYNLSDDTTCSTYLTATGDQNNVNPLLGALQDNGGATHTMALGAGSPALNAIPSGSCTVSTDQRGVARPQDVACDIGAYEGEPTIPQPGPTFTVNTTADTNDGMCDAAHCSLREAIIAANANADTSTIAFNIPGVGIHTIQSTSPLPTITSPVIIDGTTQPGFTGTPIIELSGVTAGMNADGLRILSGNSTVKGLVINRFSQNGILINTGGSNTIQGNYIGTDVTGSVDLGNTLNGVRVESSNNNIGGTAAGMRNVISGNENGVVFTGAAATNNSVQGNYIGTNAAGTGALGNTNFGVVIANGASGTTVGGSGTAGNLISGNNPSNSALTGAGIGVGGGYNIVLGNKVGTDVTGTLNLGNGFAGIWLENADNTTLGGTTAGQGNTIAFNQGDGIYFRYNSGQAVGNLILGNSIFGNTGLGINLGNTDGVTPNDTGDTDTGANNLQNFPVLTTAYTSPGLTTMTGSLNSEASKTYRLEFFANPSCDASGYGEGQTYLGFANVATDANGDAVINVSLPVNVPVGQAITATATDPDNNTSEFSACVVVTESPVILPTSVPNAAPVPAYYDSPTVTLTWNTVSWAVGYIIQVDDNQNFTSPDVYTPPASARSQDVTVHGDGVYYWRIRALNVTNTVTPWSAPQPFRVGAP
jgi:CSLREA domain-containing protein